MAKKHNSRCSNMLKRLVLYQNLTALSFMANTTLAYAPLFTTVHAVQSMELRPLWLNQQWSNQQQSNQQSAFLRAPCARRLLDRPQKLRWNILDQRRQTKCLKARLVFQSLATRQGCSPNLKMGPLACQAIKDKNLSSKMRLQIFPGRQQAALCLPAQALCALL